LPLPPPPLVLPDFAVSALSGSTESLFSLSFKSMTPTPSQSPQDLLRQQPLPNTVASSTLSADIDFNLFDQAAVSSPLSLLSSPLPLPLPLPRDTLLATQAKASAASQRQPSPLFFQAQSVPTTTPAFPAFVPLTSAVSSSIAPHESRQALESQQQLRQLPAVLSSSSSSSNNNNTTNASALALLYRSISHPDYVDRNAQSSPPTVPPSRSHPKSPPSDRFKPY
jgi:hypothetical protein